MKQNGVVCYSGPALLFFVFRFEYLISGPKSYRDFRETGLWMGAAAKKDLLSKESFKTQSLV